MNTITLTSIFYPVYIKLNARSYISIMQDSEFVITENAEKQVAFASLPPGHRQFIENILKFMSHLDNLTHGDLADGVDLITPADVKN